MSGFRVEGRGPSILAGTLKLAGAVAFVAVAAATWLSAPAVDGTGQTRLAAVLSRGVDEPLTTGSIANSANATRLDPCALPTPTGAAMSRAR